MTTQYTPILQLALPVTGELNGTWGDVVNDNITSMVEEAIAGMATINTWVGASHTLTTADGLTDEARCAMLVASGAPGSAATIICPARTKAYIVTNNVTGGFAVTLKTAAGTGVSVPNGSSAFLYCNGTNVVTAVTIPTVTFNTPLAVVGNSTAGAEIRLPEDTDNGSNYVALKAPDALAGNITYTFPDAAGTSGQVVGTTGSGNLVFTSLITGLKETKVAVAASDIDVATGNYFTKTISTTTTFTVSNVPSTGTAASFILNLTNGGSATVNWWSGMKWAGGTAPTLTASGRDVLGFFTYDGGTTWSGFVLGKDVK